MPTIEEISERYVALLTGDKLKAIGCHIKKTQEREKHNTAGFSIFNEF